MSNATPTAAKTTAAKKPAAKKADDRADDQRKETAEAGNAGSAAGAGDGGRETVFEGQKPVAPATPTPASAHDAGGKSEGDASTSTTDTRPVSSPAGKKSTDKPEAKTAEGGAGDPAGPAADGLIAITVIGPARGMRRCGRHFDATPRVVRVTTGELKAIESDPALAVTRGAVAGVAGPEEGTPSSRNVGDYLDKTGAPIAIKVLGPAKGRRRGGHEFGGLAVTITPASKDELELILGDAELSVSPAS